MRHSNFFFPAATLLLGGILLSSCGSNQSDTSTSTPSSTLGTDSAASKVGGMTDSAGTGGTMSAPASGTGNPGGTTMNGGGTGSTGTSNTGSSMGGNTGTAGTPTTGGTGASGTTNGTGAN